MKKFFMIPIALLSFLPGIGQSIESKVTRYGMGAQYTHEFVLDGFIRVREWELEGDKMKLKDLGMTSYPAIQLFVRKHFHKNNSLTLTYDNYFISGKNTFERDIAYNGTLINGRNGIDVAPTRYFRLSAHYKGRLVEASFFELQYVVGLVYDRFTFYLDGEVSKSSPRSEVYEAFGKQALPYPVVGLKGTAESWARSTVNFEVSGTYIPEFKSFFTEGGAMHLQYTNLEADLNYSKPIGKFDMALGTKLRTMYLKQESDEDTNELSTVTAGPYVRIAYNF